MKREALTRYLDELLDSRRFRDYCPNGLQVEGRAEVQHIVSGVTASLALVDAAITRGADTLLVHHGWFWRGEEGRVTGFRKARLQALLKHDINLIAYHLPLDGHVEFGNNAQLAKHLGWSVEGRFGEQDIGWFGRLPKPMTLAELATSVAAGLGRAPQVIASGASPEQPMHRIAWCSGGAQSLFELAIAQGVEVYLSGEISEQNVHLARESGVPYIAAGHHATERFGVQALAAHLAERFGLTCEFVDIDNPV
ncbi:MAG: Nif3-like dinuclear metal center hexameric protein [Propionivibrio sp.]|uniref:Nif3-like dinuclear metal center hexameric protein n=1 Tax=Propionivibrio sp. TaxID=2212460 RepID=UPI0025D8D5E5|nr:Nif3-like dinuclear metal center hexameric protein [Propionivibrio sp.]MBL0208607.1 Nif3-like dinuclear metal center hexameric protein [Propionivibrio sp.]